MKNYTKYFRLITQCWQATTSRCLSLGLGHMPEADVRFLFTLWNTWLHILYILHYITYMCVFYIALIRVCVFVSYTLYILFLHFWFLPRSASLTNFQFIKNTKQVHLYVFFLFHFQYCARGLHVPVIYMEL